MLYLATLAYLALVYLRPTELVAAWAELPVVVMASVVTMPFLAWELFLHPRRPIELPQDRFVLGYWFAIILSNLAWGWLGGALLGFTTFGQVIFQYVLLRTAIRRPEHLRGVVWLLTSVMAFHAVSGIVQHFTGTGFGGVAPLQMGGAIRIRSVGIFNDPNDLAMAILVVIPFLLAALFARSTGMLTRTLALVMLLPLLLAFYYANSRGGVLAFAAVVTVLGWQRFGRLTGTAAAAVAVVALIALGPSRLQQMDADEASAQGRIQAWSEGLQMLKSRPITGVGYSLFTDHHTMVAHNSFVHSFAELGFLGVFCFVGMAYWYFESLRRVRSRIAAGLLQGAWHSGFVATGVGLLVGLCFLSRQYNPVPYTVLALGACYVGLDQESGRAARVVGWRDRVLVLALTFMTVLVTWIAVRLFAVWGGSF